MGTLKDPDLGDEFPMTYPEFQMHIQGIPSWDPREHKDPCVAIFEHGSTDVREPALSHEQCGGPYTPCWMYDHLQSRARYGCVADWLEENP